MFALLRTPRQVLIGAGQRRAVGAVAAGLGRRAFVCTDERFADSEHFAEMLHLLSVAGVDVTSYTGALPNVPTSQLEETVDAARRGAPDMIIGMGGGSCLDLAKTVSVLLVHGGAARDYYGEFKVPGPTLPVIALPTTAGTGSEVTPVAVLSDPDRISKVGISSPHIIPHTAICDPELTYGAPPELTASAGADALSHAVEAFTAIEREATSELSQQRVFVGKNALTDQYALLAVRLIAQHLHQAWSCPDDAAAREGMLLAATAGGYALGTAGTAAAHAIQYPLGAITATSHGAGVGSLLPYVMEFNRPAREREFAQLADALGVQPGNGQPDRAAAAIDAVADLLGAVGIPATLSDLGLAQDKISWVAEQSMSAARLIENNPRELDAAAVEAIVRAAYEGDRSKLRDGSRLVGAQPSAQSTRSAR